MALRSMTGFARADGTIDGIPFHWELRSVNSKGLDVRLRLPPGTESLEPKVRELIAKSVTRGSLSLTLAIEAGAAGGAIRINEQALSVMLEAVEKLAKRERFAKARPEGVLALRGVIESSDQALHLSEASGFALLAALETGVRALLTARAEEGQRLGAVFADQISRIEEIVQRIAGLPCRQPAAVTDRLREQIERLTGASPALSEERLHQEAMLLATRADVEEELKRLAAHIEAARALLTRTDAVGRRLDFLSQEFNREANTICSKSSDIEMTRLGLDLKAVIDQLREQVQNIE